MADHEIVTLTIRPSFGEAIEVRVASANGFDGDEDLTLSARQGFLLDGEPWTTKLAPEDARHLWDILGRFELWGVRSDIVGLDGSTFSLEIQCAQLGVSLEWWESPPEGWPGPIELADELLRLAGPKAATYRR